MLTAPYLAPLQPTLAPRQGMPDSAITEKPRPYAAQGKRLRARRKELAAAGLLVNAAGHRVSKLEQVADLAGVSVSALGQWERGETWPKAANKAAIAKAMQWTVEELDYGLQSPPIEGSDVASHPVSPDEVELLALYRGLEDQKAEAREKLRAMLHTRLTMKQHVRGPLRTLSDTEVEEKAPITKTLRTGKLPVAKRPKPAEE